MDEDLNLVHSKASTSGEVSSCRDGHLLGLNDPSPVEIGPAHDASISEKAFSCRHDDLKQIKDQLIAQIPLNLKVISIVGMGGIGKTTLAKGIYEDTEISHHFHLRAWITVSQEYKLRNVLLGLLRSIGLLGDEVSERGNEDLAEMLYRSLKGMRYLIVLDDMWSTYTWNDLKPIFPNDNNGSRIILTSRLMEVAAFADTGNPPHCLKCLSDDESWRLLCNELFVGKPCPADLVDTGKEIAKKCQGLPLAIAVVAGHLSNVDKNQDCWANTAKGLDALITGNEEQILDILCLSYNYLPQHLKACFLYMGLFPKSSEILVKKVIRLWCAVGFLHPECPESMEDEAEKCVEDLMSRNLITVRKKEYDGRAKTFAVHDLLWDLSLREARKEGHDIFGQSDFGQSHSISTSDDMKYLMGLTSSYMDFKRSHRSNFRSVIVCFGQLKVLHIRSQFFKDFPDEVTQIVSLRYLELSTRGDIPGSISRLCNLETLINSRPMVGSIFPKEIWLLQRLRHLHVGISIFLPNTSDATFGGSSVSSLSDLQTLFTINFESCTEQVFSSIPNLKQLKIQERGEEHLIDEMGEEDKHLFDCLNNLSCLRQLEKLNLRFSMQRRRLPQNLCPDTFPPTLKKLTLRESRLPWEDMNILAMLPNLEVLKLKKDAFKGFVYEQTLEGFPKLKVLTFEFLDLKQWIADTIPFPVLQRLRLIFCDFLEEIPFCIGEVPTLESIELKYCTWSADRSARTIQQEQQSTGNYDLQVRIIPFDLPPRTKSINCRLLVIKSARGLVNINRRCKEFVSRKLKHFQRRLVDPLIFWEKKSVKGRVIRLTNRCCTSCPSDYEQAH